MILTESPSLHNCQTFQPCTGALVLLDRHECADEMWLAVIIWMCVLALRSRLCGTDLCDWTGSGFPADSRIVLQVRLRCTRGSVRWIYPGQGLRVVLQPSLSSARRSAVCIKAWPSLRGASVYVERSGELELLVADGGRSEDQVFCFRPDGPRWPTVYLQTSPQTDGAWSRRGTGFRYELLGNRSAALHLDTHASCRPCDDTELLLAVCSSDFVARGSIAGVSHRPERQTSLVEVRSARVYRQHGQMFERRPAEASWRGRILAPLRCGVRPGVGEFLFTGSERFGEAWLGCAPRYRDFLSVYAAAWAARRNPCDFPLD